MSPNDIDTFLEKWTEDLLDSEYPDERAMSLFEPNYEDNLEDDPKY